MIAYAAHQFELATLQGDGRSLREHLEAVARQTGRAPDALSGPKCPESLIYVWEIYCEMISLAEPGSALTWRDIESWCVARHERLTPCETDMLIDLERTRRKAANRK